MGTTIVRLSCEHCGEASEITTRIVNGRIEIENEEDAIKCPQCGEMAFSWSEDAWEDVPTLIHKINLVS